MKSWHTVETPCLMVETRRMQANIERMQRSCDANGVELRPHIKTHKMVYVGESQLAAGAAGLVCAKLAEAEAMLRTGVKSIFVAYAIVGSDKVARLRHLYEKLEELILAVTSEAHFVELDRLLAEADLSLPVMLALDTGLHREGVRNIDDGVNLAEKIRASDRMELHGLYCHEGHAYRKASSEKAVLARDTLHQLKSLEDAIGGNLRLWPGCSVTAKILAETGAVDAVRPGAYVFGDIAHAVRLETMNMEDVALTVAATVVDRPESGLALIDAGSKVFSGDKCPETGLSGMVLDGRGIVVSKVSEEHGFVTGADVDSLKVGEKLRLIVAHVCPSLNLADEVVLLDGEEIIGTSPVDARGCVR